MQQSRNMFENAKKLTGKFESIEGEYIKYLSKEIVEAYPNDQIDVQLRTIVYLLARYGYIKSEDGQSNCVDFLSMQVKHVDLSKQCELHFNWMDRNDIEYDRTMRVNTQLYTLFEKFLHGKSNDERIFDSLSYGNVLDYVQTTYGNGLKPMDFIIYIASKTFEKILNEMSEEWLASYPSANRCTGLVKRYREAVIFVRELLNHKHLETIDSFIDPRIFVSWCVQFSYNLIKNQLFIHPSVIV